MFLFTESIVLKIPLDYDIDYYSDSPSVYVEYELQPELKR